MRHLERRNRADNSRGTRKLARHDARRVHRRPKRSPPHLGPERNEQRVAGLRHASGDNDDVRVQNIEQIGNSGAEVASGIAHDLARHGVALLRGLVHRLGGDRVELATDHRRQQRRRFLAHQHFARARRDRRARRVRLETAVVAALAVATVEVDGRVADLAGDVRRAVKQLAVDDQTTADAGADRHADDVFPAARRALPPFADRRAVRVVVERDGKAQSFADAIAQRKVLPTEVRSDDDETLFAVQWTRGSHADADDVASVRIRLGERVEHHAFDQPDYTIGHALRTRFGARRNRAHGEVLLAVRRHRADDDVRSAEVDADDVLLSFLGAHSADSR